MVTSVLQNLELRAVAGMLHCEGYRNPCGVSVVTFRYSLHSNLKELEVILSYQVDVHGSNHASTQQGRIPEGSWISGNKDPTQYSNVFEEVKRMDKFDTVRHRC